MTQIADRITRHLFLVSFCGLAIFIPFSIAGANVSIMLGFLATVVAALTSPEARKRYRTVWRDPMLLASVLLVLSALPSVFMSENIGRARGDWESYWLLLIYFLVAYNLVSNRLRTRVFWIVFASATISSMVALAQGLAGGYRPSSTLYTMTFAGIMYQLIAVNSAVLLQRIRPARTSVILGAGILVQLAALLFTLTRGAWMALFAGLFAAAIVLRKRRVLVLGIAVTAIAAALALQNPTLRDRARTLVDNISHPTDKNIHARLVLWDISWEIIRTHPVFGIGMGDYTIEAERLLRERQIPTTVDSHNIYLQILATRGIFGFCFFVFFWFALVRLLFGVYGRIRDTDTFAKHFAAGTIAATVAVLVGALSENNIDDSEVFICFMFLVGMTSSYGRSAASDPPQPVEEAGSQETRPVRREDRD